MIQYSSNKPDRATDNYWQREGTKPEFGLCCRLAIVSSSLQSGFHIFFHQDPSIKLVAVTVQRNT